MTLTIDHKSFKKAYIYKHLRQLSSCCCNHIQFCHIETIKISLHVYCIHAKPSHLTDQKKRSNAFHQVTLLILYPGRNSWSWAKRWSLPGSFKVSMLFAHILEKTSWIMLLNRDHHLDINIRFMKVVCEDILSMLFLVISRSFTPPLGALFTVVIKIRYIHGWEAATFTINQSFTWKAPGETAGPFQTFECWPTPRRGDQRLHASTKHGDEICTCDENRSRGGCHIYVHATTVSTFLPIKMTKPVTIGLGPNKHIDKNTI